MSLWKVAYTQLAERDLRSIYEYIAFSLFEPETARKQVRRILDAVAKLSNLPHRYKLYQNEPWRGKGLRVMPVDNYLVFYLTEPNQNIVLIARLMYGGRDFSTQLMQTEVPADFMDKMAEAVDQEKTGDIMDADDSINQIRKKHHP